MFSIGIVGSCCSRVCVPSVASVNTIVVTMRAQSVRVLRCRSRSREKRLHAFTNRDCDTMQTHYRTFAAPVCMCATGGGTKNAIIGKRKNGKGKYETAHFAKMENACTEKASTMQLA